MLKSVWFSIAIPVFCIAMELSQELRFVELVFFSLMDSKGVSPEDQQTRVMRRETDHRAPSRNRIYQDEAQWMVTTAQRLNIGKVSYLLPIKSNHIHFLCIRNYRIFALIKFAGRTKDHRGIQALRSSPTNIAFPNH